MDHSPVPVRWLDRRTPPHLLTLVLLAALAAIAQNLFLPSLPAMATSFGTSYAVMQLAVSLFLGLSGVLQLFIGPLADRFGRRPVILWSGVVFILASLGALLAPTVEVFLLFRMMQAVIAGVMVLSRAIVRDIVPPAEAAAMIGYVTMSMSLVPMVAPTIGGLLEEWFGWQASFLLLLLAGVGVMVITWFDLGETAGTRHTSFAAQFRSLPELLRAVQFWAYAAAAAAATGAFYSFLGAAPAIGAVAYGLGPAEIGYYFAAPSTGYILGNLASARLATRLGIARMMLMGTGTLWVGMVLLVLAQFFGGPHPLWFFGPIVMVGLGNGMSLPSANVGMMSVRPDLIGTASGLGGALMTGGGAAMAALAATLVGDGSATRAFALLMLATATLSLLAAVFAARRGDQGW